jgi:hypothetical protein
MVSTVAAVATGERAAMGNDRRQANLIDIGLAIILFLATLYLIGQIVAALAQ